MTASARAVELATAGGPGGAPTSSARTSSCSTSASSSSSPTRSSLASGDNEPQVQAIVDGIEDGAARARGQAGAPRGPGRRALGAPRLLRHRRPRPAHRGARVLRPRAALEGLPGDRRSPTATPTAGAPRSERPTAPPPPTAPPGWCCCATGGPPGTPTAASRASSTRRWTTPGVAPGRRGRPGGARARPAVVLASDLDRGRVHRRRAHARRGPGRPQHPALREIHLGGWQGLTRAEITARYPHEYEAWTSGVDVRRGGGETYEEVASARHGRLPAALTEAGERRAGRRGHPRRHGAGGDRGRPGAPSPSTGGGSARSATAGGACCCGPPSGWRLVGHDVGVDPRPRDSAGALGAGASRAARRGLAVLPRSDRRPELLTHPRHLPERAGGRADGGARPDPGRRRDPDGLDRARRVVGADEGPGRLRAAAAAGRRRGARGRVDGPAPGGAADLPAGRASPSCARAACGGRCAAPTTGPTRRWCARCAVGCGRCRRWPPTTTSPAASARCGTSTRACRSWGSPRPGTPRPTTAGSTPGHPAARAAARAWGEREGVPMVELEPLVGPERDAGRNNPDGMHWGFETHRRVGGALAAAVSAAWTDARLQG